jgi:hypothetical protein
MVSSDWSDVARDTFHVTKSWDDPIKNDLEIFRIRRPLLIILYTALLLHEDCTNDITIFDIRALDGNKLKRDTS